MRMIHVAFLILLISYISPAILLEISSISSVIDDLCGFTYDDGPNGPSNWGNLQSDWYLCKDGLEQSPISIDTNQTKALPSLLSFNYATSTVELKNECDSTKLLWPSTNDDFIEWKNEKYLVQNLHWHTPSEHTVNGRRYDLEGHIVHKSVFTDKYLVIGILYVFGCEDTFLSKIIDTFPSLQYVGNATSGEKGNVSLSDIDFGDSFYHYNGSLTTPPCIEDITWIVMGKEHTASSEQIYQVRNFEGINSRPLQLLNGRQVYEFTSSINNLASFS